MPSPWRQYHRSLRKLLLGENSYFVSSTFLGLVLLDSSEVVTCANSAFGS